MLDDSVYTGAAIDQARRTVEAARLTVPVEYAAVYASPLSVDKVDHSYEVVPQPRAFEWNLLHHEILETSCMDIDGALCRDPSDDENDDGEGYLAFLRDVPPRLVPSVRVGHLVTSRLERYRAETEAWLKASGVRYDELVMHPAPTAAARREAADHGQYKARVYKRLGAPLFVESDVRQAVVIANESGKPVYCTDVRRMLYPGATVEGSGGDSPRAIDALRWQVRHQVDNKVKQVRRRAARLRGEG